MHRTPRRLLSFALTLPCLCVAGLAPSVARAQSTFVETFNGGGNEGGWTVGTGDESIVPTGGNPGAHLYVPLVDTFAPQPATTLGVVSQFTGNYRTRGVVEVGVDLITHAVDFSTEGRPLSIILVSDNATPADFDDDWGAYNIGAVNIPHVGQGWVSYDFAVPSRAPSLPAGWTFIQFGPNAPASPTWIALVSKVTQLRFFYGDPELFFIFQQWELGLDNPRVRTGILSTDPGRIPPTMALERLSSTSVRITWSPPDCTGAHDYGVYEGTIGNWTSHASIDCHDASGDLSETFSVSPGDRYYLVVPANASAEGSYGRASNSIERTPGLGACRPAQALSCP